MNPIRFRSAAAPAETAGEPTRKKATRTRSVGTKVTSAEYAALVDAAAPRSVGEWAREILLGVSPKPTRAHARPPEGGWNGRMRHDDGPNEDTPDRSHG